MLLLSTATLECSFLIVHADPGAIDNVSTNGVGTLLW